MTTNADEAVTLAGTVQADGQPGVLVSTHQPWPDIADETLMNPDGMNAHSILGHPGIVHNEKVVA